MTVPTPPNPTSHAATRQPAVDGGRLWAGGAATAVVAALVAVVGVLIAQGILDIDMVRPVLLFDATDSFVGDYALTSAILALVATGLAHLLLLTTPRPTAFFSWIVGLATVVAAAAPFAADASQGSRLATSVVNALVGLAILTLLAGVMSRAVRWSRPTVR
jgi:Family of unknown function (DUF6069)